MHFRGDGKHNLRNEDCLNLRLVGTSPAARRAVFKEGSEPGPREHHVVTRVMMNPPFAQGESAQAEYRFVDHGLAQLQDNGLLFTVLPASVLYAREFAWWRANLRASHRVLCVVLFPGDLFYPVAVESVGVFLRKGGVPHGDNKVLWVRMDDDGFVKWKGFRVEKAGRHHRQWLQPLVEVARDWCIRGRESAEQPGFFEFRSVVGDELIPQAQMGTPPLDPGRFTVEAGRVIRDYLYATWRTSAEAFHEDGNAH
jgi:hypothetical protein